MASRYLEKIFEFAQREKSAKTHYYSHSSTESRGFSRRKIWKKQKQTEFGGPKGDTPQYRSNCMYCTLYSYTIVPIANFC